MKTTQNFVNRIRATAKAVRTTFIALVIGTTPLTLSEPVQAQDSTWKAGPNNGYYSAENVSWTPDQQWKSLQRIDASGQKWKGEPWVPRTSNELKFAKEGWMPAGAAFGVWQEAERPTWSDWRGNSIGKSNPLDWQIWAPYMNPTWWDGWRSARNLSILQPNWTQIDDQTWTGPTTNWMDSKVWWSLGLNQKKEIVAMPWSKETKVAIIWSVAR